MSSQHNFIDHTADIAFDVSADSLEELFVESAKAWRICVVGDISGKSLSEKNINLNAGSLEELLVNFLNEINYFLLSKKWLCVIFNKISINQELKTISAVASGFELESSIQIKEEIKSVTYHQMEIKKINDKYLTRVVFDI